MVTPSGEAAQTSASITSKRGLGREVWAALLRVRKEKIQQDPGELATQALEETRDPYSTAERRTFHS